MSKIIGQELTIDTSKLEITIDGEAIAAAALKFYQGEVTPEVTLDTYTLAFRALLDEFIDEVLERPEEYSGSGEVFSGVGRRAYKIEAQEPQQEHRHVLVDYGDEISCTRCSYSEVKE